MRGRLVTCLDDPFQTGSRALLDEPDLLELRTDQCESIEELLFVLMTLGDDRAIKHTYVNGVVQNPK